MCENKHTHTHTNTVTKTNTTHLPVNLIISSIHIPASKVSSIPIIDLIWMPTHERTRTSKHKIMIGLILFYQGWCEFGVRNVYEESEFAAFVECFACLLFGLGSCCCWGLGLVLNTF